MTKVILHADELDKATKQLLSEALMDTAQQIRKEIIERLPNKESSSIASALKVRRVDDLHYQLITETIGGLPIWDYLEHGTGVYTDEGKQWHPGKGEGGKIIPYHRPRGFYEASFEYGYEEPKKNRIQALHFIYKGEEMFRKSVLGISPRHYFKKYTETRILNIMNAAILHKGLKAELE